MRYGGRGVRIGVGGGGTGVANNDGRVLVGSGVKNGGRVGSNTRVGVRVIPDGKKVANGAGSVGV